MKPLKLGTMYDTYMNIPWVFPPLQNSKLMEKREYIEMMVLEEKSSIV